MAPDGPMVPPSNLATPIFSPLPTAQHLKGASAGDYLSAPLASSKIVNPRAYLGGSKALDSLARMIASTEQFFHPAASGSWTGDVGSSSQAVLPTSRISPSLSS